MEEQRKILFVVYRTEWWGCFDSYCRQECQEKDTLCYVMPIPRYERNEITLKADFDRVHFDSEKLALILPEEARMVDYREFSLEQGFERIYIHNPYENGSPLDTVEGKYYACNLKQYTEKLIYVSHLFNLPITDYAKCKAFDCVDAIYVSNAESKYILESKYDSKVEVVPSGIPDYLDRISSKMNLQEAAGDGRGPSSKKKLLYCVSFHDLYNGTEKQLAKMRDIFEYARGNQDILLIFRPDEDIPVLRIQQQLSDSVWRGYEELVAYFVKNKIGIYDGTPDLYEMAVLADGIICTSHPMASFFLVQGKHMLQTDWTKRLIPNREDRCIPVLWALTAEEKGEEIELWFVPNQTKLICRMTISGNVDVSAIGSNRAIGAGKAGGRKKTHKHLAGPKVEIVAEVPDEIAGGLDYINVTKIGDCLYLSPYASDGIWKYDFNTCSFSKRYLPNAVNMNIGVTFAYGKYLYMVPRMYPGIVKYDTETEEITIFDGWVEELENYVDEACKKEPYFVWAAEQEDNMLYMASAKSDVWMEFDMDSDTWTLKPMGLSGKRFVHMVKDREWVWLLPLCGDEIVLWNCRTGEGRGVYDTINVEVRNVPYSFAVDMGDCVIAFPQQKTDHLLMMKKPDFMMKKGADKIAEAAAGGAEADAETAVEADIWEKDIRVKEVRSGIPCGYEANLTEYQKQRNGGYQYVKRLASGLILAYEYYDGSFLLLNRKLQSVKKIPCRLPIEAVRYQQDIVLMNNQCRGRFHGVLSEGFSIPAMMEYFVRHGQKDRNEIRELYRRYYLQPLPIATKICYENISD